MRLLILSACLLTAACSHSSTLTTRALAPANSSARCDDLDDPQSGQDPVAYARYIQDEYYNCALRHDAIIAAEGK